jgi:flagellar hook-associated protein 1 FlgK
MAVSTFFGLQTSLSGILAHQRSLDVTGHNVANASTTGYSRQEAVLGAADAMFIPAGARLDGSGAQLGAGVGVSDYRRIRDGFLDVQYRAQATVLGEADAKARSLEGVDLALAEPGDTGLANQLGKLWTAWQNVANDPSSTAARQSLIEQAKTVASAFGQLDNQLTTMQGQAQAELDALTSSNGAVAQIATSLASVGEAIRNAYASGEKPNDLLDQRDTLLDQLSSLGSTTVVDLGDGGVKVLFGNTGTPLVDDHAVAPAPHAVWPQTLTDPGGRLGALQDLAKPGGLIDSYRAELSDVAEGLATSVNAIHKQGQLPIDFFVFDPTKGAAGLTVGVTTATLQLGRTGSSDPTVPAPAEANDLARQIAALRGGAVDDSYNAFVTRVGAEINQVARTQANATVLTNAVEDRRQSSSGVSLDEEMTNLIRFQRGYQASARTMSTLDEMLDTLINRTGRVGL